MKKIFVVLIIFVVFLSSCDMRIKDEEGFALFLYGHFIYESNACAQSHDAFEVDGIDWNEYVSEKPFVISNEHDFPIMVKITDIGGSSYEVVSPHDILTIR